jgi:hypothetical protein
MMEKLHILDLDKLKITTVKQWCVNFTYDGVQYFIHDDSDEDRCMGLYKKPKCNCSERVNGKITLEYPSEFIKLKYGKRNHNHAVYSDKYNINYSQIDKEYFAIRLTKIGFADGIMEQKVKEYEIEKLQRQIDKKQEEIDRLKEKINEITLDKKD